MTLQKAPTIGNRNGPLEAQIQGFLQSLNSHGEECPSTDSAVFPVLQELRPSGRSLKVPACSHHASSCPHSHREGPVPCTHPISGMARFSSCSPETEQVSLLFNPAPVLKQFISPASVSKAWLSVGHIKVRSCHAKPCQGKLCFQTSKCRSFCFLQACLDTCTSQQSRSEAKPEKCPCRQLSLQLRDLQAPSPAPLHCSLTPFLAWVTSTMIMLTCLTTVGKMSHPALDVLPIPLATSHKHLPVPCLKLRSPDGVSCLWQLCFFP